MRKQWVYAGIWRSDACRVRPVPGRCPAVPTCREIVPGRSRKPGPTDSATLDLTISGTGTIPAGLLAILQNFVTTLPSLGWEPVSGSTTPTSGTGTGSGSGTTTPTPPSTSRLRHHRAPRTEPGVPGERPERPRARIVRRSPRFPNPQASRWPFPAQPSWPSRCAVAPAQTEVAEPPGNAATTRVLTTRMRPEARRRLAGDVRVSSCAGLADGPALVREERGSLACGHGHEEWAARWSAATAHRIRASEFRRYDNRRRSDQGNHPRGGLRHAPLSRSRAPSASSFCPSTTSRWSIIRSPP